MDPESSSPPPLPLPRSYDDLAVLQLEPLCDTFFARELGQTRFSGTQESIWVVNIAKDVRDNERAVRVYSLFVSFHSTFFKTEVVKRWLKAVFLSMKREFCNFVPPLTDEAFQLFVRFFWNINAGDRSKANRLLHDARRHQWGLEPRFSFSISDRFLESGDDPAVSAAAESSWARYPTGQVVHIAGKSRKNLRPVGRKRINRPSSSVITKRRVTARPNFKKHKLIAKARLAPDATSSATSQDEKMTVDKGKWRRLCTLRVLASVFSSFSNGDVDVVGSDDVASDSVEKRRGRKRKVCFLAFYETLFLLGYQAQAR